MVAQPVQDPMAGSKAAEGPKQSKRTEFALRKSREIPLSSLAVFKRHCAMEPPSVDTSSPESVRSAIRQGFWTGPTSGVCPGYLQAKYEMIMMPFPSLLP
jgi:hypothetical protein